MATGRFVIGPGLVNFSLARDGAQRSHQGFLPDWHGALFFKMQRCQLQTEQSGEEENVMITKRCLLTVSACALLGLSISVQAGDPVSGAAAAAAESAQDKATDMAKDQATDMVKGKATDMAKEKATGVAGESMGGKMPSMPNVGGGMAPAAGAAALTGSGDATDMAKDAAMEKVQEQGEEMVKDAAKEQMQEGVKGAIK
ncbi:MAG: hypothetical protein H6969_07780 [Gammaproteobacteria bacterium]|nr:hypothetical protein [Gammaproteobacteria bacterium]